ncbi:MAG: glycosyltransferase family 39 protein [bacterium]
MMTGLVLKYLRPLSKYEKLALAFSVFMLLALFAVGSFHKMGGYGVETDFYWAYAPDGQRVLDGELPREPGVGPGYALTLAVFNLFIGDWFTTGKTVSILSAILCGLLTFKLFKTLFNEEVAFFTLVLWHATVLPWSIMASTDLFFAFLVSLSIYFLFRDGSISTRNLVLSGIVMGMTYLTRHNAIVLPLGVALILLLINPESWSLRVRLKSLALFGGAFLAVNLPWGYLQYASNGSAVRSDSYLIIASHFYGKGGVVSSEDMRLAAQKFDSLKSVIVYDFGHFVKHYVSNLYHHLYRVLIHSLRFPSFLFVGAGALALFPRLDRKQLSLFVFPGLSFLLLCLVHFEPRYYLYIISFFVLLVVYFLFQQDESVKNGSGWLKVRQVRILVFAATAFLLLLSSVKEIKKNISAEPRELLQIASELRPRVERSAAIIARKPHVGFLADLETVYFPEAHSLSALLDYAVAEEADYLLYGEMEAQRRPELAILLDPQNAPAELEPVYVLDHPRTVVYKIKIGKRGT